MCAQRWASSVAILNAKRKTIKPQVPIVQTQCLGEDSEISGDEGRVGAHCSIARSDASVLDSQGQRQSKKFCYKIKQLDKREAK
jgi:hypothetical protein